MFNISISPIAFSIGSIGVRWYGIMIALGVMVLVLWTLRQIKKGASISYDTALTAALVGVPSGIIVSRLLHVIDRWDYYGKNLGDIIGGSGLTVYGAILGATLGIWAYSKFSHFKFGYFADMITPGIIMAQAIGRVGCTLNGCCYGTQTLSPMALIYSSPDSFAPIGVPVQPTTVYEIVFLLVVLAAFLKLRKWLKPDGSLFLIYLSLYSLWRLGTDFFREGTSFLFGLHQAQFISIIVLVVSVPLLAYKMARQSRAEPTTKPEN